MKDALGNMLQLETLHLPGELRGKGEGEVQSVSLWGSRVVWRCPTTPRACWCGTVLRCHRLTGHVSCAMLCFACTGSNINETGAKHIAEAIRKLSALQDVDLEGTCVLCPPEHTPSSLMIAFLCYTHLRGSAVLEPDNNLRTGGVKKLVASFGKLTRLRTLNFRRECGLAARCAFLPLASEHCVWAGCCDAAHTEASLCSRLRAWFMCTPHVCVVSCGCALAGGNRKQPQFPRNESFEPGFVGLSSLAGFASAR